MQEIALPCRVCVLDLPTNNIFEIHGKPFKMRISLQQAQSELSLKENRIKTNSTQRNKTQLDSIIAQVTQSKKATNKQTKIKKINEYHAWASPNRLNNYPNIANQQQQQEINKR